MNCTLKMSLHASASTLLFGQCKSIARLTLFFHYTIRFLEVNTAVHSKTTLPNSLLALRS